MPVFRNAPVGAVSRAFGITAVRNPVPSEPGTGRGPTRDSGRRGPRNSPYRFDPAAATGETAAQATTADLPPSPPVARDTSVAPDPDARYPLAGLLRCAACQLPLRPVEMLGGRAYGAPCGCRLTVVAADLLERLVFDAVLAQPDARDADGGNSDGGGAGELAGARLATLFRRYLAEVRIGDDPNDLSFVWII